MPSVARFVYYAEFKNPSVAAIQRFPAHFATCYLLDIFRMILSQLSTLDWAGVYFSARKFRCLFFALSHSASSEKEEKPLFWLLPQVGYRMVHGTPTQSKPN